jgi:hypothetical protein
MAAWNASNFLRGNGILSAAFEADSPLGPIALAAGIPPAAFWVVLAFDQDEAAAEALLADFDAQGFTLDEGWEDDAEPDLRLLSPTLRVPCDACGRDLRPGLEERTDPAGRAACVACGTTNDIAERVFAVHGPEALAECYPRAADPDWIDPGTLLALRMPCPGCAYPLTGLAETGVCPECGRRYDKVRILEEAFFAMRRLPPDARRG